MSRSLMTKLTIDFWPKSGTCPDLNLQKTKQAKIYNTFNKNSRFFVLSYIKRDCFAKKSIDRHAVTYDIQNFMTV